jgi:hypothetical protein
MKTKLIISGLAFLAITTMASAQNKGVQNRQRNCNIRCTSYVDSNKNGICDNSENSASTASPAKRKGNGKSCGMGMGHGQGKRLNFTDANKNGICDYSETPAKK